MSTDIATPTTTLSVQVARMIRARLGEEDLSRRQLARKLGVDDTWVGKRLKGQTALTVDDLERIAQALGVTIVDLLPRDRRDATVTSVYSRPPVHSFSGWPAGYGGPTGPGRTTRTHPSPANPAGVFLTPQPSNNNHVGTPVAPTVRGR